MGVDQMQEAQGGEEFYWEKVKAGSSIIDAACLLLANKLYSDYMDASDKFRWPPEPESFAENWMRKRVLDNDQAMAQAVWRYFLCLLVERRGDE